MKKLFKSFITVTSLGISTLLPLNADAGSYQIFTYLNYENPAELSAIEKSRLILGGTTVFTRQKFTGAAGPGPLTGTAISNSVTYLPYGRIATRLAPLPQVVVGLDVTDPAYGTANYLANSIVRFQALKITFLSIDFSPKVSYQVTERLALGVGFNANLLTNPTKFDFAVPLTGPSLSGPVLINRAKGNWAYGWNAGVSFTATPKTFLSFSYFSKISHHLKGSSSLTFGTPFGPITNTSNPRATLPIPAVYSLGIVQLLMSDAIALSATARYFQWNVLKSISLGPLPAPLPPVTFPFTYRNSWQARLAARFQFSEHWAVLGEGSYDSDPSILATRGVALASCPIWSLGVGAEYFITKSLNIRLFYGHGFLRAPINTPSLDFPGFQTVGKMKISGNGIDLGLTWNF